MKKLLETLQRKWAEYLLEMFVITFGIIGAFMLNSWNEGRVNYNHAIDYHRRILVNFDQLIDQNQSRLLKSQNILDAVVHSIDLLQSGVLSSSDRETFEFAIINYGRFIVTDQKVLILQEMNSNGDLDLIYNTDIRNELIKFNARLIADEYILKTTGKTIQENQFYFDQFSRSLVNSVTHEQRVIFDFERMKNSPEFINRFSRLASAWNVQVRFSQLNIEKVMSLKAKFTAELNQLEQSK